MAGLPNGTIPVEYTRGRGAFYPVSASIATNTSNATSSVNATTAQTATTSATVGTKFPATPAIGQQVYRTDLSHLYTWTGTTWALP